MQKHNYYIYYLRDSRTGNVLYVGRSLFPMRRLHEHRVAVQHGQAPIYKFMRENNLDMFEGVTFEIVAKTNGLDEEQANELESYHTELHRQTTLNVNLGNRRDGIYSQRARKVICLTDGKEYESVAAAKKAYSNVSNLSSHLNNGTVLRCGLVFTYKDECETGRKNTDEIYVIQCLDDGKKFTSLKMCAEHYGVSSSIIYHKSTEIGKQFTVGLSGKGRFKTNVATFVRLR